MFGLEDKKKKQPEEFIFELEKELKDAKKHQELKKKIEERIQRVKEILRSGGEQDEFNRFGFLLHGYLSLLKIMSRITPKE